MRARHRERVPGFTNTAAAGVTHRRLVDVDHGPHTIGWLITDDCNRADGVGSRLLQRDDGASALLADEFRPNRLRRASAVKKAETTDPGDPSSCRAAMASLPVILEQDAAGSRTVEVRQGDRE